MIYQNLLFSHADKKFKNKIQVFIMLMGTSKPDPNPGAQQPAYHRHTKRSGLGEQGAPGRCQQPCLNNTRFPMANTTQQVLKAFQPRISK